MPRKSGGGLLRPFKSLTKKLTDEESLKKMMNIINQKKLEELKRDL